MLTRHTVRGIITARSAGKLHLAPLDDCEKQSSCTTGCGSCGGKRTAAKLIVTVPDADRFAVGSSIEVETWMVNEALGALIVFGIPLFFATGAVALRYVIAPATIESPASLIGAACAFAGGCIVVATIDRIFRRNYPSSVVTVNAPQPTVSGGDDRNG